MNNRIRPSRLYYGIAGLVFFVGASVFGLFLIRNVIGLKDSLAQLVVPGQYDITLSDVGMYTIFYEYQSVIGSKIYAARQHLSGLRCALVSKDTGERIRLSGTSMNATYSFGNRSGVSVLSFAITRPGSYEFSAWYPAGLQGPEVVLTIGRGFTKNLVTTILGGLSILFGSFAAATIIALMTFLKRRKAAVQLENHRSGRSPMVPR
ncbi:MAG: hypothetical protein GTN81_02415 [Proteobacteria bacterium]|nr:hypothetical protein [Pseudomonadota bacterium]